MGFTHLAAIERARGLLAAETARAVHAWELEAVFGLDRFDLARQFRAATGTSPDRYGLLRRLDRARALIAAGRPPATVALDTGFADQAHLTRAFAATFGFPPGRYARLTADGDTRPR